MIKSSLDEFRSNRNRRRRVARRAGWHYRSRRAEGRSQARDLVAARVDGKVVDLTRKLDHDAIGRAGAGRLARGPRRHPSFDRASDGDGGAGALSRHPGHDRSGHRGRLLLRLRAGDAVHGRGSAEDRSEDARAGEGRPQDHADRSSARGGRREILGDGREVQGRDNQRGSRGSDFDLQPGRLDGSLPRAARALDALL